MASPFLLFSATGTAIGAGGASTGTYTLTTALDSPAGNAVIVVGLGFPHFSVNNTCVDSAGHSYAQAAVWTSTGGNGVVFTFRSPTLLPAGSTIVITSHDSGGFTSNHGGFYAVSNAGYTGPDLAATAATFSGSSAVVGHPTVTTGTPHAAHETVFGMATLTAVSGGTWTPPASWTDLGQINDSGSIVSLHWVDSGPSAAPVTYNPTVTGAFLGNDISTVNAVTLNPSVAPNVGTMAIAGFAPDVLLGQFILPTTGAVAITGWAPSSLVPPGVSGKNRSSVRWLA